MTSMRHISLIVASLGMSLSLACTAFVHADTTKKNTTTVSQKTTKQTTRSDKGAKATCCDACKCEGQNKVAASSKSAETTCCGSCNHKEQAKAAASNKGAKTACCGSCKCEGQTKAAAANKSAKATCCDSCKRESQTKAAASSKEAKATCCGSCKHKGQTVAAAQTKAANSCCGNCQCKTQKGTPPEGCCKKEQPSQLATAPSDALICPVSGEKLDPKTAVQVVYNGKVYYVGCEGCKATFLKDPETYAKKAEQLSKQQGKPAPAETKETTTAPSDKLICPITEMELDAASAVRFAYNGKVYYTCCNGCRRTFLSDPETYAKKAEQLSKLQGQPEPASN